jgi:hypothetical protein
MTCSVHSATCNHVVGESAKFKKSNMNRASFGSNTREQCQVSVS